MNRRRVESLIKQMGWELISVNRHYKCKDEKGNIRIISNRRLKLCADNPKFVRGNTCNKTVWLKNKDANKLQQFKKGGKL